MIVSVEKYLQLPILFWHSVSIPQQLIAIDNITVHKTQSVKRVGDMNTQHVTNAKCELQKVCKISL